MISWHWIHVGKNRWTKLLLTRWVPDNGNLNPALWTSITHQVRWFPVYFISLNLMFKCVEKSLWQRLTNNDISNIHHWTSQLVPQVLILHCIQSNIKQRIVVLLLQHLLPTWGWDINILRSLHCRWLNCKGKAEWGALQVVKKQHLKTGKDYSKKILGWTRQ